VDKRKKSGRRRYEKERGRKMRLRKGQRQREEDSRESMKKVRA
jgi:hypothetical protein